jgi:hypothetical protein
VQCRTCLRVIQLCQPRGEAAPGTLYPLPIAPAAHFTGEKNSSPRRKSNATGLYAIRNDCLFVTGAQTGARKGTGNLAFFFNSRGDPQHSGRCRSNPTPRRCRRPARPIVRLRILARRASATSLKVTPGNSVLGCPRPAGAVALDTQAQPV